MRSAVLFASRGAALLLALGLAAPAGAQDFGGELPSWRVPGWSFTPAVAIGVVRDTNVAISGPDQFGNTASDTLFQFQPSGQLEFFSPRTTFSGSYRGAVRRYFELSNLDGLDHYAFMNLRHRINRRVTLVANDEFTRQPTTDLLQLNGLPFERVGSRFNETSVGIEARVTKGLDLATHYEWSRVDFAARSSGSQLTDGVVQGFRTQLTERLTNRVSLGGEYGIRWADLNDSARQFTYHDAGGLLEYRLGEMTRVELAGGLSHLQDRSRDITRTSPYARAGITHRTPRASFGADYKRSYTPSFFLGGSHLGQELRGFIDMPFNRNRVYVQGTAAWRRSSPVIATDNPLDTFWLRSALGYTVQRWVRIEGYHVYTNQDNRLAGGHITRQLLGTQVVFSEPVRIR